MWAAWVMQEDKLALVGKVVGKARSTGLWFGHGALGSDLRCVWPNPEVATRSDATIHGFVFVSKFSIFLLSILHEKFVF